MEINKVQQAVTVDPQQPTTVIVAQQPAHQPVAQAGCCCVPPTASGSVKGVREHYLDLARKPGGFCWPGGSHRSEASHKTMLLEPGTNTCCLMVWSPGACTKRSALCSFRVVYCHALSTPIPQRGLQAHP